MPRTAIPVTDIGFQAGIANVSFAAADFTNGNKYQNDGGDVVLLVKNTTAGPINVTVRAVADEAGRSVDKVLAVPATTGIMVAGPFRQAWWNQRTAPDVGAVGVDYSATGLNVAALRLNP
jgi:hypothetical protein